MPSLVVVLVAGYDYHFKGTDFGRICDLRRDYLIRHGLENATYWKFDFRTGEVCKDEPAKRSRRFVSQADRKRDAVSPKSYDEHRRLDPTLKTLSIKDVYSFIASEPPAGSVAELSFFSHAFVNGPILLDTSERDTFRDTVARDPLDVDARPKDFLPANMSRKDLARFRAAFTSKAQLRSWGCDGGGSWLEVFNAIRNSPEWRSRAPGKLAPSTTLRLSARKKDVSYWRIDVPSLPEPSASDKDPYRFVVALKSIANDFRAGMDQTYMAALARATGHPVAAALLGTTSAFGGRDGLMEVAQNQALQYSDFSSLIGFYRDYVGVELDPEKRGYGLFAPLTMSGQAAEIILGISRG